MAAILVISSILNVLWFLSLALAMNNALVCGVAFLILGSWVISAFILQKACAVKLRDAFKLDAFTYLVSFLVFLYVCIPSSWDIGQRRSSKLITGITYVTFIYVKAVLFLYFYKKNRLSESSISPKQIGISLLVFIFLFYAGVAFWTDHAIAPTGDEPLYLLMAQSIITDHDLNISNNYNAGQWKAFMPCGYTLNLEPLRQPNGSIYIDERVMFALLLVLPYFVGGFFATSMLMVVCSSLLIWLIYLYMVRAGFEAKRSFWVSILIAITPPMVHLSSRVYHNIIGAELTLLAFLLLTYAQRSTGIALWVSLIILVLPWFHISYVIFSMVLFLLFFGAYRRRRVMLGALCMMALFDAVIFLLYRTHTHVGMADILGIQSYDLTSKIYLSLLAHFFDQECGLFFIAPFYAFFISGFATALFRDKSYRSIARIIFVISAYLIVLGSLPAFGGGYVPERLLIPVLPFIAIFVRRHFETKRLSPWAWSVITVSILLSYLMTAIPWLAINYEAGKNTFLSSFSRYLPSFVIPGRQHYYFIIMFLLFWTVIGFLKRTKFSWR